MLFELLAVAGGVALAAAAISLRVVKQYERGLVFRFGRILDQVRGPGLAMIVPIAIAIPPMVGVGALLHRSGRGGTTAPTTGAIRRTTAPIATASRTVPGTFPADSVA